jgi:hypothetical protein
MLGGPHSRSGSYEKDKNLLKDSKYVFWRDVRPCYSIMEAFKDVMFISSLVKLGRLQCWNGDTDIGGTAFLRAYILPYGM